MVFNSTSWDLVSILYRYYEAYFMSHNLCPLENLEPWLIIVQNICYPTGTRPLSILIKDPRTLTEPLVTGQYGPWCGRRSAHHWSPSHIESVDPCYCESILQVNILLSRGFGVTGFWPDTIGTKIKHLKMTFRLISSEISVFKKNWNFRTTNRNEKLEILLNPYPGYGPYHMDH